MEHFLSTLSSFISLTRHENTSICSYSLHVGVLDDLQFQPQFRAFSRAFAAG
jgi:hypothetical protein